MQSLGVGMYETKNIRKKSFGFLVRIFETSYSCKHWQALVQTEYKKLHVSMEMILFVPEKLKTDSSRCELEIQMENE